MLLLILLAATSCKSVDCTTQVLVVGTIHNAHKTNPDFSANDIVNILDTYNPDVICVEIPESYFRKQSYLYEMMIASIYGFDKGKQVYPIDWWITTDRKEMTSYMQSDEYKVNEQKISDIVAADSIMTRFNTKYGNWDDLCRQNNHGYEFFNSKECNDFINQMCKISMSVYGDSFMNLHYESRNNKMLELIESAITENKGKRIIILTGCEHKHYFDNALSNRADVRVVDFETILPLRDVEISENINDFINRGVVRGYYDSTDFATYDVMYSRALAPFVHGMGMDQNPNTISDENLNNAKLIIEEWEEYNPSSALLYFEKGWVEFLEGDYQSALLTHEAIADRLSDFPDFNQWFSTTFYYRNLGYCYDLTNNREKAIEAYKKCKQMCEKFELDEDYAQTIYNNYELVPYKRDDN